MPPIANNLQNNSSNLILNIAPVVFEDNVISVGVTAYRDHDQLRELRRLYWQSHIFRREGEEILCVPIIENAETLGDATKDIRLSENLHLCSALIRDSLLTFLHERNFVSFDFDPIQYLSPASEDDILAASLPAGVMAPSWISIRILNEMAVRPFFLDEQSPFIGIAVDFQTKQRITVPCDQLLEAGLNIKGLYVAEMSANDDPRVHPLHRLLGRVRDIKNGELLLEDVRREDALDCIKVEDAYLEPRYDAMAACFRHVFKGRGNQVAQALRYNLHRIQNGPDKLERLQKRINTLVNRKMPFELLPGIPFTIQPFLTEAIDEASNRSFPEVSRAERPVYVFDPTGTRTSQQSDDGLTQYGPYSAYGNLFTPNTPNVVVICQKNKKGRVEEFLAKFQNGIAGSRFATGFVGKYRLKGINFEFFPSEDASASAYEQAALRAIRAYTQADKKIHLAFVQIEDTFRALEGGQNPYLVTKAAFLTHQIPVQEFTFQKAMKPDGTLAHILNTMGLAIYAKLGGTPWLMPSSRGIAHELVFGLGSAQISQGRFGEKRRYVGITTVFTGDGNYRLANLSQAVPFKQYQSAVLDSLRDTITRVRTDNNWQAGDTVRLIFHAFKPMKFAEIDAVRDLMKELGDYEVEFAYLHLAEDHPYLVFDTAQKGVYSYEIKANKGQFAPMRGIYFRLSERDTLMSLVGAREVKKPEDGMPRPLLLKLHPASSFTDDIYLARQVFLFSCHSWRNFTPGGWPVTIHYSEMIARLLGELETVQSWNPNVMYGRIGETRWFL